MEHKQVVKDLTLMLMYLTSWTHEEYGERQLRSWKGYDFDILNELVSEGFTSESKHSKSVALYDDGIVAAKELLRKKYFVKSPVMHI